MKTVKRFLLIAGIAVLAASCTTMTRTMKTPYNRVEFQKEDFEFSQQVTGEATETKIFMIDFARLFNKTFGNVDEVGTISASSSIPVIGGLIASYVNLYALYNLMEDNPGYDVVFYPTFEAKKSGLPILFQTTKVTVTARLAKIK